MLYGIYYGIISSQSMHRVQRFRLCYADVAWSVSACLAARVILSRETPSRRAAKCAKTAEPIEMLWTRASLRNHALGGPASQREGAIMGDTLRPNAH